MEPRSGNLRAQDRSFFYVILGFFLYWDSPASGFTGVVAMDLVSLRVSFYKGHVVGPKIVDGVVL